MKLESKVEKTFSNIGMRNVTIEELNDETKFDDFLSCKFNDYLVTSTLRLQTESSNNTAAHQYTQMGCQVIGGTVLHFGLLPILSKLPPLVLGQNACYGVDVDRSSTDDSLYRAQVSYKGPLLVRAEDPFVSEPIAKFTYTL